MLNRLLGNLIFFLMVKPVAEGKESCPPSVHIYDYRYTNECRLSLHTVEQSQPLSFVRFRHSDLRTNECQKNLRPIMSPIRDFLKKKSETFTKKKFKPIEF